MKTLKYTLLPAILLLALVTISSSLIPRPSPPAPYLLKGENYEKQWAQIDSLTRKGLTKSALEVVDVIFKDSKKNNNAPQFIKAVIHKMKFSSYLEEDALKKSILELEGELKDAQFPVKPVLHSILAQSYWSYYEQNRWVFMDRTETVDFVPEDLSTWDLKKIVAQVDFHYRKSLEEADKLKELPISTFDAVLMESRNARELRPTVYDFLAHRAIDFYMNEETGLTQPAFKFEIEGAKYFSAAKEFAALNITTADSTSLEYRAVLLLRDVIKFHTEDKNPDALVDADLKRLRFMRSHSVDADKDSLFLAALERSEKQHLAFPVSTEISYEIANYFFTQGNGYKKGDDDELKWKKKAAFDKCNEAIARFSSSFGASNCRSLLTSITQKSLSFNTERVNLPDKPFLALINYANLAKAGEKSAKIYFRIATLDYEKYKKFRRKYYGEEQIKELFSISKVVSETDFMLPDEGDFNTHSTELKLPPMKTGLYVVFASTSADFSTDGNAVAYTITSFSDIAFSSRQEEKGNRGFVVVSRSSGTPLQGVKAQLWEEYYNYTSREYDLRKSGVYTSDVNGQFTVKGKLERENYILQLNYNNDELFTDNAFYSYYYGDPQRQKVQSTHFFTDRAIYRPGQTIYFKGILIEKDGNNRNIVTNTKTTVTLFDVNYEKVASLDLTTNEYGTFSGTFTAPVGVLTGGMTIQNETGSHPVQVEEYKRPKFEVTFKPFSGTFKLSETVKATGSAKAYAGSNIDGAEVKYRVVRSAYFPYPWYCKRGWFPPTESMEILNGTATTDANGEFEISFEAIPDRSIKKEYKPSFTYTIYADVVDITGETRSSETSVTIGYTALNLSLDIPETLNREAKKDFTISTTNPAGEFEAAKGTLTIYKLKTPNDILRKRKWAEPDLFIYTKEQFKADFPDAVYKDENDRENFAREKEVLKLNFDTEKDKNFKSDKLSSLAQGLYLAETVSKDKYGEEVRTLNYFTLFSEKETAMPTTTADWFAPLKTTGEPGEEVKMLIGSSYKDVKVLYEVEQFDAVANKSFISQKQWLTLNNEQRLLTIPVKEEHRGNFTVHLTFFKNNEVFIHSQLITVPYTNKELDIEFETFRNKLQPGEKEEWKLKIKGKKGEKVAAEMVAALYDASLDAFAPNDWYFDIYNYFYSSMGWSSDMFSISSSNLYQKNWNPVGPYRQTHIYDQLNWFGYYFSNGYYRGGYGYDGDVLMERSASVTEEVAELQSIVVTASASRSENKKSKNAEFANGMAMMDATTVATGEDKKDVSGKFSSPPPPDEKATQQSGLGGVQARSNFSETAFFYPHLQTDEQGNVIISFTIPEALTKWKMLGFAHTKDLKYSVTQNELVTQKELMVMPNAPRFFREGDKITFSAKVSNLSEAAMTGNAQLFLFDALTMQPVDAALKNTAATKTFTAEKGQSAALSWNMEIPEGISAVTYKVVAKAGKFSDGEEMAVPVLTNRMLVTESLPLPVRYNQPKTYKLNKLLTNASTTLTNHNLTLEFTANPAWYAVQALPYMMEYPYECSEQVFSRYYANSIATHIANSSPKIKAVFDAWKRDAESDKGSTALLSNLEKNQELKSLLLEETPWVMQAKDETERKKRLALLFDLNKMSHELDGALRKLEKAQVSNGGWPWFPGMPDSRYITQHIVTGMGHLQKLNVIDFEKDRKAWNMTQQAVRYLDDRIREDYENLKKYKVDLSKNNLGSEQIQYLYARSFFQSKIEISASNKEAFNYYKGQSEIYCVVNSLYMQGMIALALHRYATKTIPADIMKSLKENSLHSDEMGMYWKDMSGGFYWHQAPIETQALLIEAFDEVTNDQDAVAELKIWLLKQKQTQDWKTTKATAEACYALLLKGTDWLEETPEVEINVGKYLVYNSNPSRGLRENEIYVGHQADAGTGYFKTSWSGEEITKEMGEVKVNVKSEKQEKGIAWGALYWQYFEQLDKITPAETPLKLTKKLFLEKPSATGPVITPVTALTVLHPGDRIKVRVELSVDRAMEFVHLKDMRASGFEPENVISQYKYQGGLGYYESTRDAATNFFFAYLPKGSYVFEYPLRVSHKGDFSNGITSIQCMYAPEFAAHSEGIRVKVE
ncbi:MAG: alpha-2-macroglobulin [Bacteroidia bacterium]